MAPARKLQRDNVASPFKTHPESINFLLPSLLPIRPVPQQSLTPHSAARVVFSSLILAMGLKELKIGIQMKTYT